METLITDIKKVLKSKRTLVEVQTEIEELTDVRGCYNHFLASYEATQMPVATAQVQLNRVLVNKRINELHLEVDKIKSEIVKVMQPVTIRRVYEPTENEVKAIMAFNSDRRFTITE